MAQEHKTSVAVAVGLLLALAFLVMMLFGGILCNRSETSYGYIDSDDNQGKAEDCYERSGVMLCKENGHTFTVKEYWMLVEGE